MADSMHHNHGAVARSMSLDGGYVGSIDQAIANLHIGRNQGHNQGLEEGLEEGYATGRNVGIREGYTEGWNAASEIANKNMAQQLAFTRAHIEEKNRLKEELATQQELILKLEEQVNTLSEENIALKQQLAKPGRAPNIDLSELVSALKQANSRLQRQVLDMENQFEARNKEYADQVWQYNRSLVFMNAVRGVLEDITSDKSPRAEEVRALFVDKYKHQIAESLKDGTIKVEPEKDEAFKRALPRTRQFIVNMLKTVGNDNEPSNSTMEP